MPESLNAQRVSFLIVGMARSGTTLLQRLLSELPSVWVPPETHFWRHAASLADAYEFPLDRASAIKAISRYSSLESSRGLDVNPADIASRLGDQTYLWDLFSALVSSLSPAGVSHLGEKTPDHTRWCIQLLRAVPELSVIGIVRDPREVYRSHLTVPRGIRDPWAFAEKWVEHSRILEDAQRLFGERVMIIRYEDLVTDPPAITRQMAEIIGVRDDAVSIAGRVTGTSQLFAEAEWWKTKALKPVVPLPQQWRDEVDEVSVAAIEWRTGDEMKRWGYEPEAQHMGAPMSAPGDAWHNVRLAGQAASVMALPVTERELDAWQQTPQQSGRRWRLRAKTLADEKNELAAQKNELAAQKNELAAQKKGLEGWRDQATQLAKVSADLTSRNRDLESKLEMLTLELGSVRESASAWKSRAEELDQEVGRLRSWLHAEKMQGLQSEQGRLVATGKLQRLRARRWWMLGGVLGRWRRSPFRLDRLLSDLLRLVTTKEPLPLMPDVSSIERKLAELRRESDGYAGEHAEDLAAAREHLESGDYEQGLETLESLPSDVSTSADVQLLRRDFYIKLGEVSQALTSVRRALAAREDPRLRNQARILEGRLRETDPNWLPRVSLVAHDGVGVAPDSVLHILKESLPFFERGYTMRSRMTLLAQRSAGFDPTVVTSLGFPRDQGFEDFVADEIIDGIVHHRLDLGPTYRTREIPYDQILSDQATLTARLSRRINPAVIQAGSGYRGYETALVGLAVAKYLAVPMIYEMRSFLEHTWTPEFDRSEEGEYYQRRHDQETRCLLNADLVITIAEAMREEIILRGVPSDKVAVVPNVVDVGRFQPRSRPGDLARRYGLGNRQVLGYISNLGAREGIDNLIKSVGILRSSGLDVAGLVVGDGPEREYLEELVSGLGLEEHFVLTGHVPNEQIEDHYALIDLFVVPRVDDRAARLVTPLKPLEAMAMEIPVMAADLPALRELVAPGVRGEIFTSGDPESLAATAAAVLDSEETMSRFTTNAKSWILEERTVESNAIRYEHILRQVMGSR